MSKSRSSSKSSSVKSSRGSSSTDKDEENTDENNFIFGRPFFEAILETKYADICETRMEYDIYLDSSNLHWYMLVHAKDGKFPYIGFEITTNHILFGKLNPTMRILETIDSGPAKESRLQLKVIARAAGAGFGAGAVGGAGIGAGVGGVIGTVLGGVATVGFGAPAGGAVGALIGAGIGGAVGGGTAGGAAGGVTRVMIKCSGSSPHKVGTIMSTMTNICKMAEAVRKGMRRYYIATNNCQHFCNNLLKKIGLPTTKTNFGKTITRVRGEFDAMKRKIQVISDKKADEHDVDNPSKTLKSPTDMPTTESKEESDDETTESEEESDNEATESEEESDDEATESEEESDDEATESEEESDDEATESEEEPDNEATESENYFDDIVFEGR